MYISDIKTIRRSICEQ